MAKTESQYLEEQAKQAAEAISATFHRAVADIGKGVNPGLWVRRHPWIALSSATAAGFAVATVSRPIPWLRRQWHDLHAPLRDAESESSNPPKPGSANDAAAESTKHHGPFGWGMTIAKEIFALGWPLISTKLAGWLASTAEASGHEGNGSGTANKENAPST